MNRKMLAVISGAGLLAASSVVTVQAQQSSGAAATDDNVFSARPIRSESMISLERAAQRLRESIQSLAQEPVGPGRERALRAAREALHDSQQAMLRLPPEYRVSGYVVSNVPIMRPSPAQNQTFSDSMNELKLAADRLRDSIQAMASRPAGERRNEAIKQAHEALLETQQAMIAVAGDGSIASRSRGEGFNKAHGGFSRPAGSGAVSGTSAAHMSDASSMKAEVPAAAGGVGLNARAMLANEADPDHNVKMVFALNTGNYLADVAINVKDANGRTVLDGVADGPWLYAKLPPGRYTATATYNGHSRTQRFTVGRSGERVAHFRWPANVEQNVAGVSPILGTGPQEVR